LKESLKICKTFVCSCGREYSLELSTDLAVENMLIEVSCPSCGEKRTITAGSLLANKASQTGSSQATTSSNLESPLSFMDSLEPSAVSGESSSSDSSPDSSESSESDSHVSSGSSDTLTELDEDEKSIYKDMFSDG